MNTSIPLDQPRYGAGPVEATRRFYRKSLTFTGRASRSEYWWSIAFESVAIALILTLIELADAASSTVAPDGTTTTGPAVWLVLALTVVFVGFTLVPSVSVSVRRLHDSNLSGWYFLAYWLPLVGGVALVVLMVLPPNRLGVRFDAPAAPGEIRLSPPIVAA